MTDIFSREKQLKVDLPPRPSTNLPLKPPRNWLPSEVTEVNKIEDEKEKCERVGEKNANFMLGKLSQPKEDKGSPHTVTSSRPDESVTKISRHQGQHSHPSQG